MRKPLIAGNWKLNKKISETKELVSELSKLIQESKLDAKALPEIIVCPPFTSIAAAAELSNGTDIKVGAQDMSQFDSGAYTGEVNIEMLQELGVDSVLIGHSERRVIFREDDLVINAKVKQALKSNMNFILCCGEELDTREAGQTDSWVEHQIEKALDGNSVNSADQFTIAYEPIWAIGTGKTCDATEANRVIKVIRAKLAALTSQELADQVRILYGGSVKPNTIEEQMSQSDIDGALVGGASLKAQDFFGIIQGCSHATIHNV